jgi:hypothetical protein
MDVTHCPVDGTPYSSRRADPGRTRFEHFCELPTTRQRSQQGDPPRRVDSEARPPDWRSCKCDEFSRRGALGRSPSQSGASEIVKVDLRAPQTLAGRPPCCVEGMPTPGSKGCRPPGSFSDMLHLPTVHSQRACHVSHRRAGSSGSICNHARCDCSSNQAR